ncbi:DUF6232 family protein [Virgisporangium aurantiacum]|uniref:Uncharacterized protein n=1 Tax=Virgisporangium aurantiacum TaxID=175570 RepID=A0A8J3ZBV1_9ACTN|nr:DUF6232 family protein [Virgisporangium aurantiacum]GIJ59988.1 hypothetical protein Vau01_075040 [Virgisporangium aurantiacum]
MGIYFQNDELIVTRNSIILIGPQTRILLAELADMRIVRGDLDPHRALAAHATSGVIVVTAALWPVLDATATVTLTGTAFAVFMVANGACQRIYPRVWELRARYRDMDVCVYSTADRQTFGQVRRAIMRATEAAG